MKDQGRTLLQKDGTKTVLAMRSDRLITSSSSRLTRSTARPLSRSATSWLWMYSMAPTSRPRVG